MTSCVVDASVAVKWLVEEEFSEQSSRLLNSSYTLLSPELLFAEVTNALWAMCRRGDMNHADVADAIEVLKTAPIMTPVSMRQLAAPAGRLAIDLKHPAYDCFYLALALHEHCRVVTADTRFYEVVQRHPYLTQRITHIADVT